MRYDIIDLQLVLNIAESGSITGGAERSNLSLPAASARVRGLESAVGMPLFVRNSRGVIPTESGHALLHHARIVVLQLEQLDSELAAAAAGMKGRVRLLCNTAALSEHLPDALGAFLTHNPEIDVDVEERTSYDIVKSLRDGSADVGIAADSVDTTGLQTRPFRSDRLVAVGNKAWLRAQGKQAGSVGFAALLDLNFVGLTADSALQRHLSLHAREAGRAMKLRARLRSFEGICRLVESGVGIAVVPESAARRNGRMHAIGWLPLKDRWAARRLAICVRDFDSLPRHTRALVDALGQSPQAAS